MIAGDRRKQVRSVCRYVESPNGPAPPNQFARAADPRCRPPATERRVGVADGPMAEPFAGAGPVVRIRLPPAESRANFRDDDKVVPGDLLAIDAVCHPQ